MKTGLDTGFFLALQEKRPYALEIWSRPNLVTSALVLYELQKSLLKGGVADAIDMLALVREALEIVPVTPEVAQQAASFAHGTGMPAINAMILASFVVSGCEEIHTRDPHFLKFTRKGTRIILDEEAPSQA